jgi:hypothetical protein
MTKTKCAMAGLAYVLSQGVLASESDLGSLARAPEFQKRVVEHVELSSGPITTNCLQTSARFSPCTIDGFQSDELLCNQSLSAS